MGFPLLIWFFLFIFHVFFLLGLFSFLCFLWGFFGPTPWLTHQASSPAPSTLHTAGASLRPLCGSTHRTDGRTPACVNWALFPFDEPSSVGTAGDLTPVTRRPWRTWSARRPSPLPVSADHSLPLMRIPPNYFSGCSRDRSVLRSRAWDVTAMLIKARDQ